MDAIYVQLAVEPDGQTMTKLNMLINAIKGSVTVIEDDDMIVLEIKYDPEELGRITGNADMLYFFA